MTSSRWQSEIVIEGKAVEAETLSYRHLPFEVPSNTARIDVRYEYSAAIGSDPHLTGGNTVDIGIFDTRGTDFLTQSFRGWSGSARIQFYISTDSATPGYLPGPIQAGTWHICLGLYKVAPEGCTYTVTITLTQEVDNAQKAHFAPRLQLADTPRPDAQKSNGWYRGELHCHTQHSDGDATPEEIIAVAESLDLDFLAITDHNNSTHLAELNEINTRLMLIPGYEVTTYKGHWNIWGGQDWIDFRVLTPERMKKALQAAEEAGYLVSCNHPRPYGPAWEFEDVDDYACVEVWNGPWELFNQAALEFWEKRLRSGHKLVAVGGSDTHFLHREHIAKLGHPTTWIYCDDTPSPAKLLDNLRAGHVFISDSPDGPQVMISTGEAMMGDSIKRSMDEQLSLLVSARNAANLRLQIYNANGCMEERELNEPNADYEISINAGGTPYIRAQLVETDVEGGHIRALTNPIYID